MRNVLIAIAGLVFFAAGLFGASYAIHVGNGHWWGFPSFMVCGLAACIGVIVLAIGLAGFPVD